MDNDQEVLRLKRENYKLEQIIIDLNARMAIRDEQWRRLNKALEEKRLRQEAEDRESEAARDNLNAQLKEMSRIHQFQIDILSLDSMSREELEELLNKTQATIDGLEQSIPYAHDDHEREMFSSELERCKIRKERIEAKFNIMNIQAGWTKQTPVSQVDMSTQASLEALQRMSAKKSFDKKEKVRHPHHIEPIDDDKSQYNPQDLPNISSQVDLASRIRNPNYKTKKLHTHHQYNDTDTAVMKTLADPKLKQRCSTTLRNTKIDNSETQNSEFTNIHIDDAKLSQYFSSTEPLHRPQESSRFVYIAILYNTASGVCTSIKNATSYMCSSIMMHLNSGYNIVFGRLNGTYDIHINNEQLNNTTSKVEEILHERRSSCDEEFNLNFNEKK